MMHMMMMKVVYKGGGGDGRRVCDSPTARCPSSWCPGGRRGPWPAPQLYRQDRQWPGGGRVSVDAVTPGCGGGVYLLRRCLGR